MSNNNSFNTIFNKWYIEVNKKSKALVCQLQVTNYLGFPYWVHLFYSF